MDYVAVAAASEAAYMAKRSLVHHADAKNPRMPSFDELTNDQHLAVANQAAEAIGGNCPRVGWSDPDRVFYLVARIVARAIGHEVGDPWE